MLAGQKAAAAQNRAVAAKLDHAFREIEQLVRHAVAIKPWGHGLPDGILPTLRGMSELGG